MFFKVFIFFFLVGGSFSACTYRMGFIQSQDEWLGKEYKGLSIPVFENQTSYEGVEAYFTNFLIQQFIRSEIVQWVPEGASSQLLLIGSVEEIQLKAIGFIDPLKSSPQDRLKLPRGTVLASNYDIYVKVSLRLVEKNSRKLIWKRNFNGKESYQAPQIGLKGINSSNSLYNHRARLNKIKEIAERLMAEAHDSIVEGF